MNWLFPHIYSATLPPLRLPDSEVIEQPAPHKAVEIAASVTGIPVANIMARRCYHPWANARALAGWLLYYHYQWSHRQIADLWGASDHSFSIILSRRLDRLCKSDVWKRYRDAAIKAIK